MLPFGAALALVSVAGCAIRVAHQLLVMRNLHLGLDSTWYLLEAGVIRHHGAYADPNVFAAHRAATAAWPPLYPALLAIVQVVFGNAARTAQLAGAVTGGVTVALTGFLARRVADDVTALFAAALAAVSPLLIAVDGSLMSETLFVPLALATALAVSHAVRRPGLGMWVLAGAFTGLATLTRVDGVLLFLCVVAPAAVFGRERIGMRLSQVAVAGAAVVLVVVPWVARNAARVDSATIATVSSGTAIGGANCHDAYYGRALGSWSFACIDTQLRTTLDETRWSARVRDDGARYAVHHLGRVPVVAAARVARVSGLWPPGDQVDRESLETRSRTWQWIVVVTSPFVVAAGIAGLVVLGRRGRGRSIAPLAGLVATSALVALLGYGNTRFRAAAEPALLIGIAALLRAWARALRPPARPGRPTPGLPR